MDTKIDALIIGGGQAGLSLSYYLKQAGREHVVLEKAAQAGSAWRNQRWESFTLVTPNWSFRLPGFDYDGPEPNGFMKRDAIVARFEQYVARNALPVQYNTPVSAVDAAPDGQGFIVRAGEDTWHARQVVVASGIFQHNRVPPFAQALPGEVQQIASSQYRSPQALQPGAVLVVGSGQSGTQIAEELYKAGRKVYLSVGSTGRTPCYYRGKHFYEWMVVTGFMDRTLEQMPDPNMRNFSPPTITGRNGGYALNLHRFYRDGVTLLGHLRGVVDDCLVLAPDLPESLGKSDGFEAMQIKMIDTYIEKAAAAGRISPPPTETVEQLRDAYGAPQVESLDLRQAGITTVIWAMGHRPDFSMVHLPVFDDYGFPRQKTGATQVPGLFFIGLPFQDTLKSALLLGVGDTAARVAEMMGVR